MSVMNDVEGVPTAEQASTLIDEAMQGDEPAVEPTPNEPAAVAVAQPDAEPAQAQPDAATDDEPKPEGDTAPAPEAVAEGQTSDVTPEQAEPTSDAGQSAEHYVAPVREDAQEILRAIDTELKELFQKYDEGDLSGSEFFEKQRELYAAREQLNIEQALSEHSVKVAEHNQRQAWTAAQQRFFERNVDWREDSVRYNALDSAVRAVASEEASQGKSHDWILNEAKSRIERAFGLGQPPAQTQAETAVPKPAPAKPSTPISLTDMPGTPAAGASEYEVVSNKDPLSMLDDVMSWSEDKRSAWLDRRV